jgi:hypothetical protein
MWVGGVGKIFTHEVVAANFLFFASWQTADAT